MTAPELLPGADDEFGMKGILKFDITMDEFTSTPRSEKVDRITSPRFWEMRRLLTEFRQRLVFFDDIKEGDFVILPDVTRQRDQPWISMGFRGHTMVLSNMLGQTLEVHRTDVPILLDVVSKNS